MQMMRVLVLVLFELGIGVSLLRRMVLQIDYA